MATYLVTFTPKEPYFFGNEKTFVYPGQKNGGQFGNKYYIKSESMPSQSTIFGAVRYLLIDEKKSDYDYDKEKLKKLIGAESLDVSRDERQEFGIIKRISPVFIVRKSDGHRLVPTPRNHRIKTKNGNVAVINREYTPFSQFGDTETSEGKKKLFAKEYNPKDGLASSFTCVEDGSIVSGGAIFGRTARVGINREKTESGFFKKEFAVLSDKYSFAVYLELNDDSYQPKDMHVYLGQNKSLFEVRFTKGENDLEQKIRPLLQKGVPSVSPGSSVVYCLGDVFANRGIYEKTLFAATATKSYRVYKTDVSKEGKGRVSKGTFLYNLISAGSVLIVPADTSISDCLKCNNAAVAGYNFMISSNEQDIL